MVRGAHLVSHEAPLHLVQSGGGGLSGAAHADLMRKVQSLNLLEESNQLLRQEAQRHEQRAVEAEKQVWRA